MSYLNVIVKAIGDKKFDLIQFRGKKILLVGGYSLRCQVSEDGKKNVYFADYMKMIFDVVKAKSCKKFGMPVQQITDKVAFDYCGEIEDMPEIMNNAGKFDIVFVLEGLEKVSNPGKALSAVNDMCKNGGKIMLFLRTPAELGTKVHLDYYEDDWRYEAEDIKNFFHKAKDFHLDKLSTDEVFLCSLTKPSQKSTPPPTTLQFLTVASAGRLLMQKV